jgi:hypothetical protein
MTTLRQGRNMWHFLKTKCITVVVRQPCWAVKIKGKAHPRTDHEDPEVEYRYSSTLSFTSALDGGGWLTRRPGRFTPGKKTQYALYRRLCEPQSWSGRMRKISSPPGFDPPTFQPVASRWTDWAIPARIGLYSCYTIFIIHETRRNVIH